MQTIDAIVQRIVELGGTRRTILVAIDGCGGAGKTALSGRLSQVLAVAGHAVDVVHFDDFYLPSALRPARDVAKTVSGANFDWRRLREQVLVPLREGRDAVYARYDWPTDQLAELHTAASGTTVIVEGVTCSRRELSQFYDLRVWVDCPREIRLRRGIERDGEKSRATWERDWMPSEDRYVKEHRPHEGAEIIVSGISD